MTDKKIGKEDLFILREKFNEILENYIKENIKQNINYGTNFFWNSWTDKLFDNSIFKQDTLKNDIKNPNNSEILSGADIILANEPFGLKNLVHAECCSKVKNLKIRGTKGEPLFLQLMMESLNINGRCAVIVPEGVLFTESSIHQGTRKHLITYYNLDF